MLYVLPFSSNILQLVAPSERCGENIYTVISTFFHIQISHVMNDDMEVRLK